MTTKVAFAVSEALSKAMWDKSLQRELSAALPSAKFLIEVYHVNPKYAKAYEQALAHIDEYASKDFAIHYKAMFRSLVLEMKGDAFFLRRWCFSSDGETFSLDTDEKKELVDRRMVARFNRLAKFREAVKDILNFARLSCYKDLEPEYKIFGLEK